MDKVVSADVGAALWDQQRAFWRSGLLDHPEPKPAFADLAPTRTPLPDVVDALHEWTSDEAVLVAEWSGSSDEEDETGSRPRPPKSYSVSAWDPPCHRRDISLCGRETATNTEGSSAVPEVCLTLGLPVPVSPMLALGLRKTVCAGLRFLDPPLPRGTSPQSRRGRQHHRFTAWQALAGLTRRMWLGRADERGAASAVSYGITGSCGPALLQSGATASEASAGAAGTLGTPVAGSSLQLSVAVAPCAHQCHAHWHARHGGADTTVSLRVEIPRAAAEAPIASAAWATPAAEATPGGALCCMALLQARAADEAAASLATGAAASSLCAVWAEWPAAAAAAAARVLSAALPAAPFPFGTATLLPLPHCPAPGAAVILALSREAGLRRPSAHPAPAAQGAGVAASRAAIEQCAFPADLLHAWDLLHRQRELASGYEDRLASEPLLALSCVTATHGTGPWLPLPAGLVITAADAPPSCSAGCGCPASGAFYGVPAGASSAGCAGAAQRIVFAGVQAADAGAGAGTGAEAYAAVTSGARAVRGVVGVAAVRLPPALLSRSAAASALSSALDGATDTAAAGTSIESPQICMATLPLRVGADGAGVGVGASKRKSSSSAATAVVPTAVRCDGRLVYVGLSDGALLVSDYKQLLAAAAGTARAGTGKATGSTPAAPAAADTRSPAAAVAGAGAAPSPAAGIAPASVFIADGTAISWRTLELQRKYHAGAWEALRQQADGAAPSAPAAAASPPGMTAATIIDGAASHSLACAVTALDVGPSVIAVGYASGLVALWSRRDHSLLHVLAPPAVSWPAAPPMRSKSSGKMSSAGSATASDGDGSMLWSPAASDAGVGGPAALAASARSRALRKGMRLNEYRSEAAAHLPHECGSRAAVVADARLSSPSMPRAAGGVAGADAAFASGHCCATDEARQACRDVLLRRAEALGLKERQGNSNAGDAGSAPTPASAASGGAGSSSGSSGACHSASPWPWLSPAVTHIAVHEDFPLASVPQPAAGLPGGGPSLATTSERARNAAEAAGLIAWSRHDGSGEAVQVHVRDCTAASGRVKFHNSMPTEEEMEAEAAAERERRGPGFVSEPSCGCPLDAALLYGC